MSSFSARTSYIKWDDDDVHFVLDQHAELDFYCASSLRQQTCCSTRTHYPDSELREEVANTNFIVFGFNRSVLKSTTITPTICLNIIVINTITIFLIFSNLIVRIGKPEVIVPELIKSLSHVLNLVFHEEVCLF